MKGRVKMIGEGGVKRMGKGGVRKIVRGRRIEEGGNNLDAAIHKSHTHISPILCVPAHTYSLFTLPLIWPVWSVRELILILLPLLVTVMSSNLSLGT